VPLFESTLGWLANRGQEYLVSGEDKGLIGNAHPSIVPYQTFDASDKPLVVAVGNNSQFAWLCKAVGRPERPRQHPRRRVRRRPRPGLRHAAGHNSCFGRPHEDARLPDPHRQRTPPHPPPTSHPGPAHGRTPRLVKRHAKNAEATGFRFQASGVRHATASGNRNYRPYQDLKPVA
jgi:hypothetical protein